MTLATPSRRRFLRAGSASLAATPFLATLGVLQMRQAVAATGSSAAVIGPYGPVAPVADLATGLPLLQLPAGFEYRSFGWTGDPMDDGQPCPGSHDGMAVVQSRARGRGDVHVVLVRNHERGLGVPIQAAARYDTTLIATGGGSQPPGGGTTNLVFRGRSWVGMEPSLGGTLVNCAGGPTPWGTWLTCEETGTDLRPQGGKKHGYVFEVRAPAGATTGVPIVAMGRFSHEAVAIDPRTGFAYLTEDDRNKSGLYRFIPTDRSRSAGSYEKGGRLQMAKAVGRSNADLIVASVGDTLAIEWVDIADPDADRVAIDTAFPLADASGSVSGPFAQGWRAGGLRMSRGEGIWYSGGKLYIVDTSTGVDGSNRPGRGEGAVWEFDPMTGVMRALFVSLDQAAANNPDNITVSPRGGIVLCEDGGTSIDVYGPGARLVGLTAQAEPYVFAKNGVVLSADAVSAAGKLVAPGDYRGSEFCGACFDPAGKVMFVNIQTPGITFAIWGPWASGNL
jgi:secreted PhoX family phosphatase